MSQIDTLSSLPPEYQHIIQLTQEQHHITITLLQELVGGFSGAVIYLVGVTYADTGRVEHYVLKLDRTGKKTASDEIVRHDQARSLSPPGFDRAHIPNMVFDRVESEQALAIFYAIAGYSLLEFRPLSKYRNQSQLEKLFTATYQHVLAEWNRDLTFDQGHPQSLLKNWLGFRLDPGRHIEHFLSETCRVSSDSSGFLVNGHVFPNPLLYARSQEPWGNTRTTTAIYGLQHGDLNTNNILARFDPQNGGIDGYYLIDFALFKPNMPLLYDLRYLEISYLLHAMSAGSLSTSLDLIVRLGEKDILEPYHAPFEMAGTAAVIRSGRLAFDTWVSENHPTLHDDLWGQYWLAGVAAGLAYVHKAAQPEDQRLAGLIYAAANLNRFANLFDLPAPSEAHTIFDKKQLDRRTLIETAKSFTSPSPTQMTRSISEPPSIPDAKPKQENRLEKLIALASEEYSSADFDFLSEKVYFESLTSEEQQQFGHLLTFACTLQNKNSFYETVYNHLQFLYVLNNSRLGHLKSIERRLRGLVEGQGALILISGVAGIGKTSLVMAFQERVQQIGAELILARCSEQGSTSYGIWQDVAWAASRTGISIENLSAPIGKGQEARSSNQLKQDFAKWLVKCAAVHPLVILLDDLHWADADSLEVLDYLTSQPKPTAILVIATHRSEGGQSRGSLDTFLPKFRRNRQVDLLHLEPLTEDDILRLVEAYHGPCSSQLAVYLNDRAAGHPLFLVELLRDLVESSLLRKNKMGYWLPPEQNVPVPTLLQQVISQRLKRLSAEAGTLLEVAAIVGETWDLEVVEAVLGWPEDDLLSRLEEALAARIIKATGLHSERYQFAHSLIQVVLYDRQLARRRKGRHEKILQLLEGRWAGAATASPTVDVEAINALAYHSRMAEQWEKAYAYNGMAGDASRDRFAMHSTIHFYQQALDAAQQMPDGVTLSERMLLYEQLGEAFTAINNMREAESAFADMATIAQKAGEDSIKGRALSKLAVSRDSLYQPQKALRTHQEARSVAEETGESSLLALAHFNLGHHYLVYGDLLRCREHLGQAVSSARAADEPKILADSLRNLGILDTFCGRYAQAETQRMEALALVQMEKHQIGLTSLQWGIGLHYIEQGKYEKAREAIQAGLDNIENLREVHYYLVKLQNLMGYLYNELGDFATALKWDLKALETSQRDETSRNNESHCYTLLNVATDYLHAGRLTEAIETVRRFEAEDEKIEYSRFRYLNRYYLLLAELALACGEYEQCFEYVEKAAEMAHSNGIPKNIAKCLLFKGQALLRLNRPEEATGCLDEAVMLADEIGHASLRWKTRLRLAEAYTLLEKPAFNVYRQAVDLVDKIAANLQDQSLRASFLQSALVVELKANAQSALKEQDQSEIPSKPKGYPADLTEREVQVLRLIASGDSNPQIAETLFISVRTVSTHVTNILNKTNCDNRTAAAAFAVKHDLI